MVTIRTSTGHETCISSSRMGLFGRKPCVFQTPSSFTHNCQRAPAHAEADPGHPPRSSAALYGGSSPGRSDSLSGKPPPPRKVFAAAFRPASAHAEETRKWPPTSNVACRQVPSLEPPKVNRPGCLQPPRPDTLSQPLHMHLLF